MIRLQPTNKEAVTAVLFHLMWEYETAETDRERDKHMASAHQLRLLVAPKKCRKRGHSSSWIRKEKRARVYERDRWICVYCTRGHYPRDLTLDHVVPRSKGGTNDVSNLVTACRSCNSSLQNATYKDLHAWCRRKGLNHRDVLKRIRNARRRKLPD